MVKVLFVLALFLHSNLQAFANGEEEFNELLLPNHVEPEYYNIKLVPFLIPGNFTTKGSVEITVNCVEPNTQNVTLHASELNVQNVKVACIDTETFLEVSGFRMDDEKDFMIIDLNEELKVGSKYVIKVDFIAKLNDQLHGFYRNQFFDENGKEKFMAVTQFEPTYARSSFPCFDEPARKARFEVTLGRTKNMSSISNMPIKAGRRSVPMVDTDDYVWDEYEATVPMSTYLVAFVVSDFDYEVSEPVGNNVTFRVWARHQAMDQIKYAKEIGPKLLKYFEDFFQVPYPLPKMDMIAIPDFSAGAMENWGLVTYRESAMLVKQGLSSQSDIEAVADTISHELAHQWFGNLVSPSWWSDLWLNEGFASYIEHVGLEGVAPELNKMQRNQIFEVHRAMALDALKSSHPISVPVKNPDQIAEIFDTISYTKGASVIRMMDFFLGRETFRKGLSTYLNEKKFSNANQDDLWRHLNQQAIKDKALPEDLTVKTIMDTWTLQTGFPVVTMERDYSSRTAKLSQKRFQLSPEANNDTSKWWIPITYCQPGFMNFRKTDNPLWLGPDDKTMIIGNLPDEDTPLVVNIQETGYYRVNYDSRNWNLLKKQLFTDNKDIHVLNRAQIMDDVFSFARSGLLPYSTALGFSEYLSNETNYIVWHPANRGLNYISKMFKKTPAYGDFTRYLRSIVRPWFSRMGYESLRRDGEIDMEGNDNNDLFRKNIFSWACSLSLKECCNAVTKEFNQWMETKDPDNASSNQFATNMKATAYCSAVREGGEKEWMFLWQRYLSSNVAAEKNRMLGALACTKELWLLSKFLHLAVTPDSGIRKQDVRRVFGRVAGNIYGRDLAFDFVRENWNSLKEYLGAKNVGKMTKGSLLDGRNTNCELDALRRFYSLNEHNFGSGLRSIQQAIERTERNIEWMDHNYQEIWTWLKAQNYKSERRGVVDQNMT